MSKRIELGRIRFIAAWGDTLVHRTWSEDARDYAVGICIPFCYGRFIGRDEYTSTDEEVTCLECLGHEVDRLPESAAPMNEHHQRSLRGHGEY